MMNSRRPRSVGPLGMEVGDYINILRKWKAEQGYDALFGRRVQQVTKVTPSMVVRCYSLLDELMTKGCEDATVLPRRLEQGFELKIDEHDGCNEADIKLRAAQLTEHVKSSFGLLRLLKLEDMDNDIHGRFPKTGAFRRAMSPADAILINTLVERIKGLAAKPLSRDPSPARSTGEADRPTPLPSPSLSSVVSDTADWLELFFRKGTTSWTVTTLTRARCSTSPRLTATSLARCAT